MQEQLLLEEEEKKIFKIDNDDLAEWALNKIKEMQEERDRLIAVCENKINEYQDKIEGFKKHYESESSFFIGQLTQYFETVKHKKTKTQESYVLPTGKLIRKKQNPKYEMDEKILTSWVKTFNVDLIQVTEKVNWRELKNQLNTVEDYLVTSEGEEVPGVKVIKRQDKFEIKF